MNADPHDGRRIEPGTEFVDEIEAARGTEGATDQSTPDAAVADDPELDLDAIERDLADVETALQRLEAGTYWTDEVTGAPIPDVQLAENPVTRRTRPGSEAP